MPYLAWNHRLLLERSDLINLPGRSSVALIEHGLGDSELEQLRAAVRAEVNRRLLTDEWWTVRALPLLVVAVEVGYRYGDGSTVYWPALQEALGRTLREEERARIPQLIRGVGHVRRPPSVPWAGRFCRIAWPISEAVLPAWLHAPLLELLQRCPMPLVRGENGERRYLRWLEGEVGGDGRLSLLFNSDRRELAAAMIEGILDGTSAGRPGPGELEPSSSLVSLAFVQRARRDVLASEVTRRLRLRVRERQVVLRAPPTPPPPPPRPPSLRAMLRVDLILNTEQLSLRTAPARHPALTAERLRLARAAPLAEQRPIMLSELLRAGATLTALPVAPSQPLVAERWRAPLSGPDRLAVGALWVDSRQPLLFSARTGASGCARQVAERAFRPIDGWFVVTDSPLAEAEGVYLKGKVAGGWAHEVDASKAAARARLEQLGLVCVSAPVVSLIGAPPLDSAASDDFSPADLLAVQVEGGPVTVHEEGRSPLLLPEGHYLLDRAIEAAITKVGPAVAPTEGSPTLRARRRKGDPVEPGPPLITLAPGAEASLDSLRAGTLGLVVRRPQGAVGLRVRLRLTALGPGGEVSVTAWSRRLGTLPAAVPPSDPAWAALGQACPDGAGLTLSAELPGIGRERWSFTPAEAERSDFVSAPLVGEADVDSRAGEDPPTDEGRSAPRWWAAQAPDGALRTQPLGVALLGPEDGLFGPTGEVVGPAASPLYALQFAGSVDVSRAPDAVRRAFAGLWRWRRARSLGGPAALARAAVIRAYDRGLTEQLCGADWAEREANLSAFQDPWPVCAERLLTDGIAWQGDLDRPPIEALPRIRAHLTEELRGAGRSRLRTSPEGAPERASVANLILGMLDRSLRSVGLSQDPPCEEGAVVSALRPAWSGEGSGEVFRPLVQLILPQSSRPELLTVVGARLPLAELTAQLGSLVRRPSTAVPWRDDEIMTLIALWTGERPRDWASSGALVTRVMDRAVSDQRGCRIARLASLACSGGWPLGEVS